MWSELHDVPQARIPGAGVIDRPLHGYRYPRDCLPEQGVILYRLAFGDLEDDRSLVVRLLQDLPEAGGSNTSAGETLTLSAASTGRARAWASVLARVAISRSIPRPTAAASANRRSGDAPSSNLVRAS